MSFLFANRELAFCSPPLGTHPLNKHSCEGQGPTLQRQPEAPERRLSRPRATGVLQGPQVQQALPSGFGRIGGSGWCSGGGGFGMAGPVPLPAAGRRPQTGRGGGRRWGQGPATSAPRRQGPAAGLCFAFWTVDAQCEFQVCCSD